MSDPFDVGWSRFRAETRLGFSVTDPTAHCKVTGVDTTKRSVREALANLEEMNPDEAALLREHIDCGRSTDPQWDDE